MPYIDNALPAVRISWEMISRPDDTRDRPDERDEGFYPSLDPNAAGYVGDESQCLSEDTTQAERFAYQQSAAEQRMSDWENDVWEYVGIIARAHIFIPCGGGSCVNYTMDSPGLWGIESDAGEYLRQVFDEQKEELRSHLATLSAAMICPAPLVEEDAE